jgi:regulator of cell morphogenesis and NO signaling
MSEEERLTVMRPARSIDVRELQGSDCQGSILEAFDGLAPGECLVVLGGQESRVALHRLQTERKGLFEWSPIEAGPLVFRTEVARRAAEPGAARGVAEALAWDHDRLDALDRRAFERFAGGDLQGAGATWSELVVGLKRHIRFEEDIVFPTFEQLLGTPSAHGPTGMMRAEHREIERLIDGVGRAFAGDGLAAEWRSDLHRVLGEHNQKEEHVIYPGIDRCLAPPERDALVARIQAS